MPRNASSRGMKRLAWSLAAGLWLAGCAGSGGADSRPGGPGEPVRYRGGEAADMTHEGGLRLAVGAHNYQAFRANRSYPEAAEGYGWVYNHAPMLAYWNGRFYLQYLSGPVHENVPPIHTLLTWSPDGVNWVKPVVTFPTYQLSDGSFALMHQRMGFYVAPNGRLLVLGFYGFAKHPNNGTGIGRVVREVLSDNTFGPIYYIRYNSHNGFDESNTQYLFYRKSTDAGFVEACEALLADKLMTLQWWEEDRSADGFYYPMGEELKALSFYHRKDGKVVGLWKSQWSALSPDEGRSWTKPVKVPTLVMAQAKVWGQKTSDGRYALLYNPRADNRHRWPLAIVTGEDGVLFDDLLAVQGEVAPRRYNGTDKAYGPQYVRGIAEGNGTPPGNSLWVTYSMNKEDLWLSRIPLPVCGRVSGAVKEDFNQARTEDLEWNLHSPIWARVAVADFPSSINRSLGLWDSDPGDYAKAVRVFPESLELTVKFKLLARQSDHGRLEIELLDRHGYRPPVRIHLNEDGRILALDGDRADVVELARYRPDNWYEFEIRADVDKSHFDLLLDGRLVLEGAEMLDPVRSLERLSFRTGAFRESPTLRDPKSPGCDLPRGDERLAEAAFFLDDVEVQVIRPAQDGWK
jgi:hypothetical protein